MTTSSDTTVSLVHDMATNDGLKNQSTIGHKDNNFSTIQQRYSFNLIKYSLRNRHANDYDDEEPFEVFVLRQDIASQYNQFGQKLNSLSDPSHVLFFIKELQIWRQLFKEKDYWDESIATAYACNKFIAGKAKHDINNNGLAIHKFQNIDRLIQWIIDHTQLRKYYLQLQNEIENIEYNQSKTIIENFHDFETTVFKFKYLECVLHQKEYDYDNGYNQDKYIQMFIQSMDPFYGKRYNHYLKKQFMLHNNFQEPKSVQQFESILNITEKQIAVEKETAEITRNSSPQTISTSTTNINSKKEKENKNISQNANRNNNINANKNTSKNKHKNENNNAKKSKTESQAPTHKCRQRKRKRGKRRNKPESHKTQQQSPSKHKQQENHQTHNVHRNQPQQVQNQQHTSTAHHHKHITKTKNKHVI